MPAVRPFLSIGWRSPRPGACGYAAGFTVKLQDAGEGAFGNSRLHAAKTPGLPNPVSESFPEFAASRFPGAAAPWQRRRHVRFL